MNQDEPNRLCSDRFSLFELLDEEASSEVAEMTRQRVEMEEGGAEG